MQNIFSPTIATFPIGALLDNKTVPIGSSIRDEALTPKYVNFRSVELTIKESSFNSAGVIHKYSPFQYSGILVLGVEPEIIFPISFILKKFHSFLSFNKGSPNIFANKDLSIYELIKNSIQNNGELPEDFKLPPKDPNGVPWADGAMDGVYIYHTVGNEEDIEPLKNIVFQISEGKFEEAETNLDKLDFSMVSRTNSLLSWIIQEQKQINLNNLYEFASSRLVTTKNIEVIKFCLSVLAIMNVETDAETIEKVKILALSDEFTLYCLNIFVKLENSNKEIFEIAKKVKGWGRVHSIGYLEVTNDEIKEWILEEGCHNDVLPAYTAYTCAKKINLIEILNDGKISNKKFNDISYLMNALLDESAITGMSALEDRELLIERYLEKAKTLSSTEEDYEVVRLIKEYVEDNEEIDKKFIKICDNILNSNKK